MNWTLIGSLAGTLLGGLGIGSTISSYLTSGQSRRTSRGAVLERLSEVEDARWAGPEDNISYSTFLTKCRSLETAALIARVPREAVVHYLIYAHVARMRSQDNWDQYGEEEAGGFIEPPVDKFVREAAAALTRVVWQPWLQRVSLTSRLENERKAIRDKADADTRKDIERAREHLGLPSEKVETVSQRSLHT